MWHRGSFARYVLLWLKLLGAGAALSASRTTAADLVVNRWEPHDFPFRAALPPAENPFLVTFDATVTGPAGIRFKVPGFYDGEGIWKIRVSANAPGHWTITTGSDHPQLSGQRAAFTCIANPNPRIHGALRVDAQHPRHFVFEDGTRFFLQGYECDWLGALDLGKPDVGRTARFLDKIASHGFNYIILNAYAHDTNWRRGTTGPDDYGPPKLYAWEGTNEKPEHERFNLSYWQSYDRIITALHQRGLQAHVLMKVYNKRVTWPERGSRADDMYFRWLVARYGAYPNVIWDFAKEAHLEKDLDYKLGRIRFVREHDGHRRLLTTHDDDKANDSGAYDEWHDFRTDQQHPHYRAAVLHQHARREWPVFNAESHYEWGPGGPEDKTWRNAQSPEECLRIAWEIAMAGGYMAYYYTYTAWDVIRPDDTPIGYAYFRHFGEFFRATQYWTLKSSDHLVSTGWCLADPGREYVVFLEKPQPFTLKIGGPGSDLAAYWFNPHTGRKTDLPHVSFRTPLTPPSDWPLDIPLVLHIRRRSAQASASPAGDREPAIGARSGTLFVDQNHSSASDRGSGEADAPFKTISAAAKAARPGQTIRIAPGTYREAVMLEHGGEPGAPITFEGAERGRVVISGGDVLTGWKRVPGDQPVYTTPWSHDFIARASMTGIDARMRGSQKPVAPVHCAEMFVYRDRPLWQVLSMAELAPGKFFVDWDADTVSVHLPDGDAPIGVEGVSRSTLFAAKNDGAARNIVVKGIVFRHGATWPQQALVICDANWRIEDCVFEWSNARGLTVRDGAQIVRCIGQDNGQMGFGGGGRDLLVQDCTLRRNNWKGYNVSWEAGGCKFVKVDGMRLENMTAYANHGLDRDNQGSGIFIEISPGPALVERNVCYVNTGPGIKLAESTHIVVRENLLVSNGSGVEFRNMAARGYPFGQISITRNRIKGSRLAGIKTEGERWSLADAAKYDVRVDENLYDVSGAAATLVAWAKSKFDSLPELHRELSFEQAGRIGEIAFDRPIPPVKSRRAQGAQPFQRALDEKHPGETVVPPASR